MTSGGNDRPGPAETFERSVEEGEHRLSRSWPALLATGTVGGLDVGVGIFGLLVVHQATGQRLLGALAFGFGFMALTLARSELFTENFLIPIVATIAGRAKAVAVLRLWGGTALMNLGGGWVVMMLVIAAFPRLERTAIEGGTGFADQGIGWTSFASAVLAGMIVTLMTWMEHGTTSDIAKLAAVWATGFLLAAGPLAHVIVMSLEMFAALQATAPFGYADWLGMMGWATLGNIVGGLGLVTALRLVQVGRGKVDDTRAESDTPAAA